MADEVAAHTDLALDHIVHVVHDPNGVRKDFEREFGVNTVSGGEHSAWGTYNALSYFGLSYIEWLGVRDTAIAATSAFGRLAQLRLSFGEGGSLFAVRTSQMERMARSWQQRGLSFVGPVDASRKRPDGTTVRWKMLFPRSFDGSEVERGEAMLPFVIEWENDDSTRAFDLQQTGAIPSQQIYKMGGAHVVTRDVDAWLNGWNDYFSEHACTPERRHFQGSDSFFMEVGGTTLYVESMQENAAELGNERTRFPGVDRIDLIRMERTDEAPSNKRRVMAGLSVHVVR